MASLQPKYADLLSRESILVSGSTCKADFDALDATGCLSINVAYGGRVDCSAPEKQMAIDDDVYLILNPFTRFTKSISSHQPVYAFSIFFRRGLPEDVLGTLGTPVDELPEGRVTPKPGPEWFDEHLSIHDQIVSPVLKYLSTVCQTGFDDERWYEEQLTFLLERMLIRRKNIASDIKKLTTVRRGSRAKVYRRLNNARDFMQSNYERPLDLKSIADHACFSPYHFLRLFKSVYHITPYQFLLQKRIKVACRLLKDEDHSITAIASQVGFQSRVTLLRNFRNMTGISPMAYRAQNYGYRS